MLRPLACLLAALALGLACDLDGDGGSDDLCRGVGFTQARFYLDLGDYPVDAGAPLVLDAACTITQVASIGFLIECTDAAENSLQVPVDLILSDPQEGPPVSVGQEVDLHLRRPAGGTWEDGFFTIRRKTGEIVVGGANDDALAPPGEPDFFAPLSFTADAAACPEVPVEGSCYLVRRLLLTVDDGEGSAVVTTEHTVELSTGYRVQVAVASAYRPADDACPPVDDEPPTHRFVIVATQ